MPLKSSLDLIDECDNFPYPLAHSQQSNSIGHKGYWYFQHQGTTLGYITLFVLERIDWDPEIWVVDPQSRTVELKAGDNAQERSRVLAHFWGGLREKEVFEVLKGWRGEVYPIYGPRGEVLMSMERAATPLFGVVTYGVHMIAYVKDQQDREEMKIWVPRRASTKQTYPGMMDNTVAGGITTGEKVLDCLVREAREEASLPETFVRENARPCGTVTYFHVRDERAGGETGLCQPECQYVYDLELPGDVVLSPGDDEAVDFRLLSVEEVRMALGRGEFKPNCAVVLLDFFVRHGVLTPENDRDYIELVSRLHRRLEFPMP